MQHLAESMAYGVSHCRRSLHRNNQQNKLYTSESITNEQQIVMHHHIKRLAFERCQNDATTTTEKVKTTDKNYE